MKKRQAERQVDEVKALIEFCSSNVSSYTEKVIEILEREADWDVDVVEYGCLGFCEECFMTPFALVNGEFVSAPTAEELLEKIKQKLKEDEESEDVPY